MKSYYVLTLKGSFQIQRIGNGHYPWIIWDWDDELNEYCRYVECFKTLRDAREYVKSL